MLNEVNKSFGLRIIELRLNLGISQEELATISGLHRTYIGALERGEKSPTLKTIYKISRAFGLSLMEFFNYDT